MRLPRAWKLVVGIVAVAGLAALALRQPALRVETAVLDFGPLMVTIDEEGMTRVRERFQVAAPVTGLLSRPVLRAGDSVRAGQVLAWLDPAPLDPRAVEQARARLRSAEDAAREAGAALVTLRAALEQARRTSDRAESLATAGLVAPEERERAALEVTRARQEIQTAEFRAAAATHDVEAARAVLLAATGPVRAGIRTPVRAPVGGHVLRVFEESERLVAAGTPVAELGDLRTLEVVADLLTTDAVRVERGDTVLLEDWGGPETILARVTEVEPSAFTKLSALGVEEQRVNVVAALLSPRGALGDQFRVEARVVLWHQDSVLKAPVSALFRARDGWAVFAVEEGRARRRIVEVGHRGATEAEIAGGLAAGAVVIRYPGDQVRDGTRVVPVPPRP